MQKYIFQLKNLTCEACVKIAKRKIEKMEGVVDVDLNLDGKLEITANNEIAKGDIEQALENTKYKVA
jgi:copper chaperone CopZ